MEIEKQIEDLRMLDTHSLFDKHLISGMYEME